MSIIAGKELYDLVLKKVITADPEQVNTSSIDVTLGDEILMESSDGDVVDIAAKQSIKWDKVKIGDEGVIIYPGQVFLANTREFFNLPADISATFVLKSSIARNFLNHMLAGYADAGWNGSTLTMEFKNESMFHPLLIKKGMRIGQMVFHKHSDTGEMSYGLKGSYNGQKTVTAAYGNK